MAAPVGPSLLLLSLLKVMDDVNESVCFTLVETLSLFNKVFMVRRKFLFYTIFGCEASQIKKKIPQKEIKSLKVKYLLKIQVLGTMEEKATKLGLVPFSFIPFCFQMLLGTRRNWQFNMPSLIRTKASRWPRLVALVPGGC